MRRRDLLKTSSIAGAAVLSSWARGDGGQFRGRHGCGGVAIAPIGTLAWA